MLIRFFNVILSFVAICVLFIPFCLVFIAVKLTSPGPAIHWSKRIGKNNIIFKMPKFRTMRIDTPQVATHLLDGKSYLTSIGGFLRKSSLDELPQLWSVLIGDMNLVGPRPALFNQDDLIQLRTNLGVHNLAPGITGWAQINGRDDISLKKKSELDAEYLRNRTLILDIKIIIITLVKVLSKKNIKH